MRKLVVLAIVLAGVWLGGEVVLTGVARGSLQDAAEERAPDAGSVATRIEGFPVISRTLFAGSVPEVGIRLTDVTLGPLDFAVFDLELRDVGLDRAALLRGQAKPRAVGSGLVTADLEAAALSELLPGDITMRRGVIVVMIRGRSVTVDVHAVEGELQLRAADLPAALRIPLPSADYLPCTPDVEVGDGALHLSCAVERIPDALVEVVGEVLIR